MKNHSQFDSAEIYEELKTKLLFLLPYGPMSKIDDIIFTLDHFIDAKMQEFERGLRVRYREREETKE